MKYIVCVVAFALSGLASAVVASNNLPFDLAFIFRFAVLPAIFFGIAVWSCFYRGSSSASIVFMLAACILASSLAFTIGVFTIGLGTFVAGGLGAAIVGRGVMNKYPYMKIWPAVVAGVIGGIIWQQAHILDIETQDLFIMSFKLYATWHVLVGLGLLYGIESPIPARVSAKTSQPKPKRDIGLLIAIFAIALIAFIVRTYYQISKMQF